MINTPIDRLQVLLDEDDLLDQLLLDVDPDTAAFWELTAQREAVQKTIAILRSKK